ncbi:MAG: DUF3368 domain-containing protein [Bacteroidota bacterium]
MPDLQSVVDTSVLIGLSHLGRLDLLPTLLGTVLAPSAVIREFGSLPDGVQERLVQDTAQVQEHRAQFLGVGEAEVIALAHELRVELVLIDERRARRYAAAQGLTVVGTAGILVQAKRAGLLAAVQPLLETLRRRGFRLSDRLYNHVLTLASEKPR